MDHKRIEMGQVEDAGAAYDLHLADRTAVPFVLERIILIMLFLFVPSIVENVFFAN